MTQERRFVEIVADHENKRVTVGNVVFDRPYFFLHGKVNRPSSAPRWLRPLHQDIIRKLDGCFYATPGPPYENKKTPPAKSPEHNCYLVFTMILGVRPAKFVRIFNAKMFDVFLREHKYWAKKFCYSNRGLNTRRAEKLLASVDLLNQCKEDGIENVTPFVFHANQSPQELKQRLGKSAWKKICKNSFHRNKILADRYSGILSADPLTSGHVHKLTAALEMPTSAIKFILEPHLSIGIDTKYEIVRLAKKFKQLAQLDKKGTTWSNMYSDILIMASKLEYKNIKKDIRKARSFDDITTLHDSLSTKMQELREADFNAEFSWYKNTKLPKQFEHNGYKFTLLSSKRELHEEGKRQKHCVYSYASSMAAGSYLVYKVGGKERATLGLISESEGFGAPDYDDYDTQAQRTWIVQQMYKACNQHVSSNARDAAKQLEKALNKEENATKKIKGAKATNVWYDEAVNIA